MVSLKPFDWFRASLPRTCMYCAFGFPVVFSAERFLDTYACGAHSARGLSSKKLTAPPHHEPGSKKDWRCYSPMMGADEACGLFEPISLESRKAGLLDLMGMFDETPWGGSMKPRNELEGEAE